MSQRNGAYYVLGAIGIIALGLYIIACGPSWSPDGKRIVFPYATRADLSRQGIALCDVRSKHVSSILELPAKNNEDAYLAAQWARDGRSVIAFVARSKVHELQVIQLPMRPGAPTRVFNLPMSDDGVAAAIYPVEVAGRLYFGGDELRRLDLESSELTQGPADQVDKDHTVVLLAQGDRILYLRETGATEDSVPTSPAPTAPEVPCPPDSQAGGTDIGEVDPGTLELHRMCTISDAEVKRLGIADGGSASYATGPGEAEITLVSSKDGKNLVLVLGRGGIQKVLEPKLEPGSVLGPLVWARHGTLAYASVFTPTADPKGLRLWIAELSADMARVRLVPITTVAETNPDDLLLESKIALSPDERTAAVSTAFSQEEETRRALFLVNLRDPKRTVTTIEYPVPPKAAGPGSR
jgi:hypothetical protein